MEELAPPSAEPPAPKAEAPPASKRRRRSRAPGGSAPSAAASASAGESAEEKECKARGGQLEHVCMRRTLRCVLHFSDAGKRCSDESDCLGDCRASQETDEKSGKPLVGRCAPDNNPCGCYFIIVHGKIAGGGCFD
jgi:hypothetical protein